MEKVIRDGKVAVLISPGLGAGWYTWNTEHTELIFSHEVVEMVEQNKANEIDEDWILENLGIENVNCGGASDLVIHWIPIGTAFEINAYDGAESIRTIDDLTMRA